MVKEKGDYDELENLFKKIENLKEFNEWFMKPCKTFEPLCSNCKFWLKWNKLKQELFEEFCQ